MMAGNPQNRVTNCVTNCLTNCVQSLLHPALLQLIRFQTRGKIKRIVSGFRSRRKIVLSVLAVLLGCVWLGQTVIAILLREPAGRDRLEIWLPVSLFLYCVFHLVKIGCRKPIEPFDWTPAEKQNLHSAPLTRMQLITYRLISYFGSIAAKATCFAIVMIPDLPNFVFGFVGMFIGLTMIDMIRVLLEQIAWLASQSGIVQWRWTRMAMLIPSLSFVVLAIAQTFCSDGFAAAIQSSNPLTLMQYFLATVSDFASQPALLMFMWPWQCVVDFILADALNVATVLRFTRLLYFALSLTSCVYIADTLSQRWLLKSAGCDAKNKTIALNSRSKNRTATRKRIPIGLGGIKAIVWYQLRGAVHYKSTLVFSLAIPTFLCCLPIVASKSGFAPAMDPSLNIIGSVVFYSFLLLPPALMLDFRRDARRLSVWKSVPLEPLAITVGQLTVPVALMSLFQGTVLTIAVSAGGMTPIWLFAWPLLIPLNVFILGMENAIFLMHPVRRNQEGIEVFLRTILTFTGKGVLFAGGLALALAWAFLSLRISHLLPWREISGPILFGAGVWLALAALAWASVKLCAQLFKRMDVSQDLPAVS